jgi:hypothetical protein
VSPDYRYTPRADTILEARRQAEAADKWRLAERMIPILESTLQTVVEIEYDPAQWDYLFDVIENYLPRAISHSTIPEAAQEELLSYLSSFQRSKAVLLNRRRQRQMIGLVVGLYQFQQKVLGFLRVRVGGIPIQEYRTTSSTVLAAVETPALPFP